MRLGGPLGLLTLLIGVTACTAGRPPEPRIDLAQSIAVPSYTAPPGAPTFCARLAASTHLVDIPTSLGTLVADPGNEGALRRLAAGREEIRLALADVLAEETDPVLVAAIEDLIGALDTAHGTRPTGETQARISDALGTLGDLVQPACRFPA